MKRMSMISCLCVTRGDRLVLLEQAMADFAHQTHAQRELVILHDGSDAVHAAIDVRARAVKNAPARVCRAVPGMRLGALRNQAVAAAAGDWVCQWDDDDRYHPLRLQLQWEAAQAEHAVACYLVDQLQWFRDERRLFWSDWDTEPYPMNVIQGTILARRDAMPPYPETARGEDTLQTHALLRQAHLAGQSVARLRGKGWCYIYSYHGANVWNRDHHDAIAHTKHLPAPTLLPRLKQLAQRLADYNPALPALQMPVGPDWRDIAPAA